MFPARFVPTFLQIVFERPEPFLPFSTVEHSRTSQRLQLVLNEIGRVPQVLPYGIESAFSLTKRGVMGSFQKISVKLPEQV